MANQESRILSGCL